MVEMPSTSNTKIAMTIHLDTVIARNDSILFSGLDDEILMMSIDNGEYYKLDEMGACIWAMLEEPSAISDLCNVLMSEFDIDLDTCRQDVLEFVNDMYSMEVITVL